MTSFAHSLCVDANKWLRVVEVELAKIGAAEQEEDDHGESHQCRDQSRREDTFGSDDICVLCLFRNVSRGFKSNKNASSNIVRQHPVPNRRSTSQIVRGGEGKLCRLETVGLRHGDREPDDVQDEVEDDQSCRNSEDPLVRLRVEVIHANCEEENALGDNPLDRAELDVGYVGDERGNAKDREL